MGDIHLVLCGDVPVHEYIVGAGARGGGIPYIQADLYEAVCAVAFVVLLNARICKAGHIGVLVAQQPVIGRGGNFHEELLFDVGVVVVVIFGGELLVGENVVPYGSSGRGGDDVYSGVVEIDLAAVGEIVEFAVEADHGSLVVVHLAVGQFAVLHFGAVELEALTVERVHYHYGFVVFARVLAEVGAESYGRGGGIARRDVRSIVAADVDELGGLGSALLYHLFAVDEKRIVACGVVAERDFYGRIVGEHGIGHFAFRQFFGLRNVEFERIFGGNEDEIIFGDAVFGYVVLLGIEGYGVAFKRDVLKAYGH